MKTLCYQIIFLSVLSTSICNAAKIHDLVKGQKPDELKNYLKENPDLVNQRDEINRVPLHYAVINFNDLSSDSEDIRKKKEIIEILMRAGADLNFFDDNDQSPYYLAQGIKKELATFIFKLDSEVRVKSVDVKTFILF